MKRFVNSSWFLVLGAWFLVLGSWCLVLGSWFLVLGAWCLVLGAWCLVLGAWWGNRYLATVCELLAEGNILMLACQMYWLVWQKCEGP
jgi:hypothetical protein